MYKIDDLNSDEIKTSFDDFMGDALPISNISFVNYTPQVCNEIFEICNKDVIWKRGTNRLEKEVDYRTSEVCFIKKNEATNILFDLGQNILKKCQTIFDFDISHMSDIQFSRYKQGQFLDWHNDDHFLYKKPENDFLIRKLSVSLQLNDPNEFEGGELYIEDNPPKKMKQGEIIAFPAFMQHKVDPVVKGVRYSLVFWFYGKRWR